jgi:hypothetical protein
VEAHPGDGDAILARTVVRLAALDRSAVGRVRHDHPPGDDGPDAALFRPVLQEESAALVRDGPKDPASGPEVEFPRRLWPRWKFPWKVVAGHPPDLRRGRFVLLDESAAGRFGPFAVGDHRKFMGLRLKIIGRTREARSFTTNPLAFLDYRLAQAMAPLDLRQRTTYILVKLEPGVDVKAVRAAIRRKLPYNDVRTKAEWIARSPGYWVENTGLGLSMYVTVFLGCLVGVVVVAQTAYTATIEHFEEFATV